MQEKMTEEMLNVFILRSNRHIQLVRSNLLMMENFMNLEKKLILERAIAHEISKFYSPERSGYIWLTWGHHCKNMGLDFECSEFTESLIELAVNHHRSSNSHHPEAFADIEDMSELDILEMVCDWTAMSQELKLNNGSCMNWARVNIDRKWKFSKSKKELIFTMILELDKRNQSVSNAIFKYTHSNIQKRLVINE